MDDEEVQAFLVDEVRLVEGVEEEVEEAGN
jgi:hypothetical protein